MQEIRILSSGKNEHETLKVEKNLILVGANGAGKSRLGSWLEQNNTPTKRISAQRYLQLNEVIQKQNFETASSQLRESYKNQPPIQPQNDYTQVLVSLFAEESSRDAKYVAASRSSEAKVEIPKSVKEQVVDCWNFIFPYRVLKLENDRVRSDNFAGTEMSDGEKGGLYLISQILLAEKNCIFIIDEPELHLHKALMVRLWNKLEEYRNDCTFIYITHDLDFAVSKPSSKLIWIQSYKDAKWEWKEIDLNEVIPENLFLEMLGSKESILFVEGDKSSLDIHIYQAYYEKFTVIPCGSCKKVIEAVKGLSAHNQLHDKKIYGLIDKDFRTEKQLTELKDAGVFSITLNEVENLFLVPEIIEMVCAHLSKGDKKEEIIEEIRKIYTTNKDTLAFATSKNRMHRHLGEKFGMVKNMQGYDGFKQTIFSELDDLTTVNLPEQGAEITEILMAYPHKGLVKEIQGKIELSKNGYKNLVLSFLSSDKRQRLVDIFKKYLPEIT